MMINLSEKNIAEQIKYELKEYGINQEENIYHAPEGQLWDIEIHGVCITGKILVITDNFLEIDESVEINISVNTGNMWVGFVEDI